MNIFSSLWRLPLSSLRIIFALTYDWDLNNLSLCVTPRCPAAHPLPSCPCSEENSPEQSCGDLRCYSEQSTLTSTSNPGSPATTAVINTKQISYWKETQWAASKQLRSLILNITRAVWPSTHVPSPLKLWHVKPLNPTGIIPSALAQETTIFTPGCLLCCCN